MSLADTRPQAGETWADREGREWLLHENGGAYYCVDDYSLVSEDNKHAWTSLGRYYSLGTESVYDLVRRVVTPAEVFKPIYPGAPAAEAISNTAPQLDALGATLAERRDTHGEYNDHARITQELKAVIRSGPSYEQCSPHERETLDMIAHKIGRVVSGNPHFTDHWHDIAGYARLSEDRNK